jgi:uncharacterized membrane protein (UPF0182 family)
MRWRLGFVIFAVILVIAVLAGGAGFYTDWVWFGSIGFSAVFWRNITWRIEAGLIIGLPVAAFVYLNLAVIRSILRRRLRVTSINEETTYTLYNASAWMDMVDAIVRSRYATWLLAGMSVIVGLLSGVRAGAAWQNLAFFANPRTFGLADPIFGQDVSYYMFRLPFWQQLQQTAFSTGLLMLAAAAGLYFLAGLLRGDQPGAKGAGTHLGLLLAFLLLLQGLSYKLQKDLLVYSTRGVVYGATYTDMHASRYIFIALMFLSFVLAAIMTYRAFRPTRRSLWLIPAALLVVSIVVGSVYPAILQQLRVKPNELTLETPYINNHINFTRIGYALNNVQNIDLGAPEPLTAETVAANDTTVKNIRIVDWRPLQTTYTQLQGLKQYYQFPDVDVDRYQVDGNYQQVMLAPRELSLDNVDAQGRTWINDHLKYTHGYGVVMSPVNTVDLRGQPLYYLRDIPPQTPYANLQITRPQIYFGELTNQYVILKTRTPEFDYPSGETNATNFYEGTGGIPLTGFNRLMFSIRFGTLNLFLSQDVSAQSRVLIYRNVVDMAQRVAPFLTFDPDPYIAIADNKLYWIVDAFTTSRYFPYSQPYPETGINYIRNSVKVVIDAYNGTMDFYVVDTTDPLIKTWEGIFPNLFKSVDTMPESIREHLRYPEGLFTIQANMLNTYHMTDPSVFYTKEDRWAVALQNYAGKTVAENPYYTIMTLPQIGTTPEFSLILPLTPIGTGETPRNNMVGWLAVRNDAPHYGEFVLYRFPKDVTVQGPNNIESRIDQDPVISQSLTLWGQVGSTVVRGDMLVIPMGKSLLYVEPLYIQSTGSSLPELKRVIVATQERLAMAETLEAALNSVLGVQPPETPTDTGQNQPPTTGPGQVTPPGTTGPSTAPATLSPETLQRLRELINELNTLLNQMQPSTAPSTGPASAPSGTTGPAAPPGAAPTIPAPGTP